MSMIRTITETEAPRLTIRGDLSDVRKGYQGPIGFRTQLDLVCIEADRNVIMYAYDGRLLDREPHEVHFDVKQPLVQAHLVGWLGRGAWCPPCGGGGFEGLVETPTRYGCPACSGSATKRGTGYLRPPADLYHLLKPQALGGLPDWIRLALIAGSVERVAAGMSALVDVADMWTEGPHDRGVRSRLSLDRSVCHAQVFPRIFRVVGPTSNPYQYHYDWCCETLPYPGHYDRLGGASAVDTYLMSKSFALVDDTPTGRVIRFEVPDAL